MGRSSYFFSSLTKHRFHIGLIYGMNSHWNILGKLTIPYCIQNPFTVGTRGQGAYFNIYKKQKKINHASLSLMGQSSDS
jgi:hypothetical protein